MTPEKSARIKKILPVAGLVLLSMTIGIGGFIALQKFAFSPTDSKTTSSDNQKHLADFKKMIDLPEETPTIAVVSDVEKLKNQEFFSRAENGDRVFVYKQAKRAFLYRPTTKKIVDVSYYNPDEQVAQTTPAPNMGVLGQTTQEATRSAKVLYVAPTPAPYAFAIRNSTDVPSLTDTFAAKIKTAYANSTVIERGFSVIQPYEKTILIGSSTLTVIDIQRMANVLGIESSPLPAGEDGVPEGADFLIIIGTDQEE